ncbi:MAG: hypothetical protein V5A57_01480 [Candidatus Paceibacterota bacterium]
MLHDNNSKLRLLNNKTNDSSYLIAICLYLDRYFQNKQAFDFKNEGGEQLKKSINLARYFLENNPETVETCTPDVQGKELLKGLDILEQLIKEGGEPGDGYSKTIETLYNFLKEYLKRKTMQDIKRSRADWVEKVRRDFSTPI